MIVYLTHSAFASSAPQADNYQTFIRDGSNEDLQEFLSGISDMDFPHVNLYTNKCCRVKKKKEL